MKKKNKKMVEKTKVTFHNANKEPAEICEVADESENWYPDNEEPEYGFCSNWNCKNPDGSKVALIDMGDYFQCGQCYRRYNK